jgi:hypothetical protein
LTEFLAPFPASEVSIHSTQVDIEFIDGGLFKRGGLVFDDFADERGLFGVGFHIPSEYDGIWTELEGLSHGHCGADTEGSGFVATGGYYTAVATATDE